MKKIVLLIFIVALASCSKEKRVIERSDLIGQWKEIERKPTKRRPPINVECKGNISGLLYTFNADSTYTAMGYCPENKIPGEKGTWMYRNNVLSITNDSIKWRYSVSDAGDKKIKFLVVTSEVNRESYVDWDLMEFSIILEKQ